MGIAAARDSTPSRPSTQRCGWRCSCEPSAARRTASPRSESETRLAGLRACGEDLPALTELHNELIASTTITWTDQSQTLSERRAAFEARVARGFPTLVAIESGAIRGMVSFGDFRDSIRWPGYRFTVEHSINVFTSAWNRGIGTALMQELFVRAHALGIHVMIGAIDSANHRSLAFHERLGFREVARLPETGWKHNRFCDLVLVQRFIDPSSEAVSRRRS